MFERVSSWPTMPVLPRRSSVLCVVFLLVVLFWFWLSQTENTTAKAPSVDSASLAASPGLSATSRANDLDDLCQEILSATLGDETPLPFKSRSCVHLKPGESAVIGFWQISKDTNGLAVITPELRSDGTMKIEARLLKVSDAVASDKAVRDLFPAPFDVEQSGAMKQEAVKAALDHLSASGGADLVSMPSILTLPGRKATLQVGQLEPGSTDPFGGMQHAIELQINPGVPGADGGLDLDLGLSVK